MNINLKEINDSFLQDNKYIFKKYKPIKKIGKGSFGNIYSAIRLKDKNVFAMKTEKLKKSKYNILESEAYYLYTLQGFGFPKLISFGHTKNYNILIETLLDKSLEDLYIKNKIESNLGDICLIGIQLLDRLEWIHSKDIIYRDIKPENFLLGINDPNVIYVIDFGLCKKYRSSKTGKHILPKITSKFNGNFQFASINALKGKESSRRDDLISLGYMLIFLLKKELPWKFKLGILNISKYFELIYLKETDGCGKLFKNLPEELIQFFKYKKTLKFEQEPNYTFLRSLLIKIIVNLKFDYEKLTFSWINLKDKKIKRIANSNSKRKSNLYIRILKNIKEEQIKKRKNEALSEPNLTNDMNRLPFSEYKSLISIKNNIESDRAIFKQSNDSKLNLMNQFNNNGIINNNKNRKINNNIRILNVKKIPQSENNNTNRKLFIKKRINEISYLNYHNNIVYNKSKNKINKKINRIFIPNHLISNYCGLTNYDYQKNSESTYLNSRKIEKEPINYLYINKNPIYKNKNKNKKINITNDTEYKSPLPKLFKYNLNKDYSTNNYNDKKINNYQKIHQKYINLIFSKKNKSIDLTNSINNNSKIKRRNNTKDFNIFVINNNINFLTKNSSLSNKILKDNF